jgi:hypothetical protein
MVVVSYQLVTAQLGVSRAAEQRRYNSSGVEGTALVHGFIETAKGSHASRDGKGISEVGCNLPYQRHSVPRAVPGDPPSGIVPTAWSYTSTLTNSSRRTLHLHLQSCGRCRSNATCRRDLEGSGASRYLSVSYTSSDSSAE